MSILNFNEFQQLITEGFIIDGNTVKFDAHSDYYVKTHFGKGKDNKPFQSKVGNCIVYSMYIKNSKADALYGEILKTLKGQSSTYVIDADSYDKFLTRTALFMSKKILSEEIDTIMIVESSSKLLVDLNLRLQKYLPKYYDMFTYSKAIFKNPDMRDIFVDYEKYGLSKETIKDLERTLKKQQIEGYFSIKKFPPNLRKTISNWLSINNSILAKVADKKIAIIDDFITSGATFEEAARMIDDAGAAKVTGFAILKGSH